MTQSTEQERAILYKGFCEWCKTVPHLGLDPRLHTHGGRIEDGGYIADTATAKAFAAWKAARRAQVVPQMADALQKIIDLNIHYCIDKYGDALKAESMECVRIARKALAAAPQPPEAGLKRENPTSNPEAAPVQMPEPVAWMLGCQTMGGDVGWKLSWSKSGAGVCHRLNGEEFEQRLYTEHQVRQLLADHGVK